MDDDLDGLSNTELWLKWINSPEGKAREKINEVLTNLSLDPEINESPICAEFVKLMLKMSPADSEAETIFDLVHLLTPYFNKRQAKSGANALHAENRSMKADVFTWLDSQPKFKSDEAAARAVIKQQPIAHGTGRAWYKEWKKMRSASTP